MRSEVHHCDLCAVRGDDLIVVELKRRLNLELVLQAARRQRITDSVYVAVPRPKSMGRGTPWRDIRHVLRRLELGLLLVTLGRRPRVEVALHPAPYQRQKRKALRRALIEEVNGRSAEHNRGGSSKTPLVTAYREQALHLAWLLHEHGPRTPRQLRELGATAKAQPILYANVYGWFDRIGHGVYALGNTGRAALQQFSHVIDTIVHER